MALTCSSTFIHRQPESLRGVGKSVRRIRVTGQLVEAETGKHVWAERYDRNLADIFAVQDDITEAVTIAVAPAILDGPCESQRGTSMLGRPISHRQGRRPGTMAGRFAGAGLPAMKSFPLIAEGRVCREVRPPERRRRGMACRGTCDGRGLAGLE